MLIIKIIALLLSLYVLVYGAEKIQTEVGAWGFLGFVCSVIWILIE